MSDYIHDWLKLLNSASVIQAKAKIVESPEEGANKPKFSFDFSKLIANAKNLIPVVNSPATSLFASARRKDSNIVFVAGAMGQAGMRIAQTLPWQGFNVRAGVPEIESAQELARLASTYKMQRISNYYFLGLYNLNGVGLFSLNGVFFLRAVLFFLFDNSIKSPLNWM